jgi:hypothetical protein
MNGESRQSYNTHVVSTSLEFVGATDLNGDRRTDLLFQNAQRRLYVETILGTTFSLGDTGLAFPSGYVPRAFIDVNGNRTGDIILHSESAGKFIVWYMSGTRRTAYNSHAAPAGGVLVARGDFNGDKLGDLGWVNPATRKVTLSLSSGTHFANAQLASAAPSGALPMDIDIWFETLRRANAGRRSHQALFVLLPARAGGSNQRAAGEFAFLRIAQDESDAVGRPRAGLARTDGFALQPAEFAIAGTGEVDAHVLGVDLAGIPFDGDDRTVPERAAGYDFRIQGQLGARTSGEGERDACGSREPGFHRNHLPPRCLVGSLA